MRSTFFVFVSIAFHALCVAAVALAPSKLNQAGTDVEMIVEDPVLKPGVEVAEAEVIQVPEVKPEPVKEAKLPPKKKAAPVAKAEPKKVIKTDFTELPEKEVKNSEIKSEDMTPEIAEENAVAVVPAKEQLIPVKDKVAGVEAMAADEETEATSKELEESDQAPSDDSGAAADKQAPPTEQVKGTPGSASKGTVSYLDLKQQPGNKGPTYPMQARRDGRQGQVELLYRVTNEGKVADVKIAKSSGHKDLDQEAVRAVSAFHFVPGQEGWARHPINFALKGSADTMPSRLRSSSAQAE